MTTDIIEMSQKIMDGVIESWTEELLERLKQLTIKEDDKG